MNIPAIKSIHMIAICGTGMGSLAGLLKEKGFNVSGSDTNVYPPMNDQLKALGIPIKIGFDAKNIETNPAPDLVIVGNAVSKSNEEVQEVLARKIPMMSMPEALERIFLAERFPIVVAGTHGKTTTSGLLSWILERTGQSPGFLVGGILKNFGRSYQLGSGDYFVVEGDEYDSAYFDKKAKFLHYHPKILILNAVEFDHADIYKDLTAVLAAFAELLESMPPDALMVACSDQPNVRDLVSKARCRVLTFGLDNNPDLTAKSISFGETTRFEFIQKGKVVGSVASPLIGAHNLRNLLGILGVLFELGIPLSEINQALSEFEGVKRRQEVFAKIRDITLIDDFAHHPTAVRETLRAVRQRYPEGRLWAIFEPRSNTTRRKVFEKEFATAFDDADEIIFAPPYLPEKIAPEERLDPEKVIENLQVRGKRARYLPTVEEIVATVSKEARPKDILCFMSNGSFGGIYEKVVTGLKSI